MSSLHVSKISLTSFHKVLACYPTTAPEKLRDLDAHRYDVIPSAVASRNGSNKHLTKPEVEKLVEWKLKHGTFRPALLGLVQSNTSQAVEEATHKAFAAVSDDKCSQSNIIHALKILTNLRGIGPATSSLLLSVLRPKEIPFFSDELFRWSCWESEVKAKESVGWQRKIKYNFKEYEMMLDRVEKLRMRLGKSPDNTPGTIVRAVDIEKVAWVLGKEGKDVGPEEEKEESQAGDDEKAPVKEEETQETKPDDTKDSKEEVTKGPAKKGTKRKAGLVKTPVESTRKSTRTKK
ncbi:hypothetical protein COCC4DRAFT_177864 [Bipolaris maydis ATCC 48331]|uniref:Uncharacterized protein n=2 Tax=Cochliobolus heterostrophus TaxID=5016 RepID=M2TG76_COCH5|nr:uncharacterized protein COCC4DRAFT_177864 [Bipolaris maydis ATCC 48331]EMD96430.1 hypothetical protein COCHEDRAFT_1122657 [Bipolaris maydis C5]KAH7548981.1 hypothetical protein BM1_10754 [Bipolaris maydis]ENI01045.1 hypothetical protein COCC4DRAFT_177864 [Bipolaris maydis ATCC 48331]KAJ5031671.1 hypothetical protein J3E73DRAFT_223980 [Bipolaris maydis]KAJ5060277.1 hypothetical protein J3E74DRAFT_271015 [Bipolaris maydis]